MRRLEREREHAKEKRRGESEQSPPRGDSKHWKEGNAKAENGPTEKPNKTTPTTKPRNTAHNRPPNLEKTKRGKEAAQKPHVDNRRTANSQQREESEPQGKGTQHASTKDEGRQQETRKARQRKRRGEERKDARRVSNNTIEKAQGICKLSTGHGVRRMRMLRSFYYSGELLSAGFVRTSRASNSNASGFPRTFFLRHRYSPLTSVIAK
ncbi:hypothetical protein WMY93_027815 [Mugilogobius chulae]|uniref:Uncharacterized protein n=1 Tax=Mugilogobius chulae TaxID=88201 RepID=A0AAW0MYC3_9GOBI